MSDRLQLHDLKPAERSKKKAIRVGRGPGGKGGKTAGRGTKGLKARNTLRPGFEGGQTPMSMRIPKLKGFRNPNKETFAIINVESLNRFAAGAVVNPDELRSRHVAQDAGMVKAQRADADHPDPNGHQTIVPRSLRSKNARNSSTSGSGCSSFRACSRACEMLSFDAKNRR